MKDEYNGIPIAEYVGLRPKMYSIMEEDEKNIKKAKGVKKSVVKKQIKHYQYKQTLMENKQLLHSTRMLRSEGHEIYGINAKKISLSPFDLKRWIADDGFEMDAYGYYPSISESEMIAAEQYLMEIFGENLG